MQLTLKYFILFSSLFILGCNNDKKNELSQAVDDARRVTVKYLDLVQQLDYASSYALLHESVQGRWGLVLINGEIRRFIKEGYVDATDFTSMERQQEWNTGNYVVDAYDELMARAERVDGLLVDYQKIEDFQGYRYAENDGLYSQDLIFLNYVSPDGKLETEIELKKSTNEEFRISKISQKEGGKLISAFPSTDAPEAPNGD